MSTSQTSSRFNIAEIAKSFPETLERLRSTRTFSRAHSGPRFRGACLSKAHGCGGA